MNQGLNSAASSGPSVGASSLVTDANSGLSGGPHLQRSASINAESYMRLPASPMSFSSNNISGSSVLDGSSILQQSPHQDYNTRPMAQRQQQQGASTATSQPTGSPCQVSQTGRQVPASLDREQNSSLPMLKKPRLDIREEDMLQQQVIQQLMQRQDSVQLQGHNAHVQALLQQQKFMQQRQQILQSMPQMQRAHLQQQQQEQQLRHQMQHGPQPSPAIKRSYDSGICARRLMQYLYHERHRPADNSILYWRKFVAEYFAPRAKRRWCLSLYDNVGHHALGVFPQAAMQNAWQCDICGSKSGRGFETTFDVLPRLNKIKFDSGVIDELLFLDMPNEYRFPSGMMMLEYGKAIQESVYEQLRVVREGQLRILFTPDLKILSWEFCVRRHEELLPRRLVTPQVNNLLQVSQKYQTAVNVGGSAGVSAQDLQTNCNMFVNAGRQLARNLDLQSLNDLGFSKRYVRCLQISEVVCSMKDLMDSSREQNIGPIESLKNYPRQAVQAKLQIQKMQEMEQLTSAQGHPSDRNTLNKVTGMHPGFSGHMNNQMGGGTPNNATTRTAVALSNYQNLLRQNSINLNSVNALRLDASPSFNTANQTQALLFQGSPVPSTPGPALQNMSMNRGSSPHSSQSLSKQSQSTSQSNQHLQQHVIQQFLQEMMNTNNGGGGLQQPSLSGQKLNDSGTMCLPARATGNMMGFGNNQGNLSANAVGMVSTRNNSFKTLSNNSPTVSGNSSMRQDTPQNLHLADMIPDIPSEFSEIGMFNDETFDWKS